MSEVFSAMRRPKFSARRSTALLISLGAALVLSAACPGGSKNLPDAGAPRPDAGGYPDGGFPDGGAVDGGCAGDLQCTGATPRCNTVTGGCVACLSLNDNCPGGAYCGGDLT